MTSERLTVAETTCEFLKSIFLSLKSVSVNLKWMLFLRLDILF